MRLILMLAFWSWSWALFAQEGAEGTDDSTHSHGIVDVPDASLAPHALTNTVRGIDNQAGIPFDLAAYALLRHYQGREGESLRILAASYNRDVEEMAEFVADVELVLEEYESAFRSLSASFCNRDIASGADFASELREQDRQQDELRRQAIVRLAQHTDADLWGQFLTRANLHRVNVSYSKVDYESLVQAKDWRRMHAERCG